MPIQTPPLDLFNFIIYDTISASPSDPPSPPPPPPPLAQPTKVAVQGRKKRRRRANVCKNKEEAETKRLTHITVERNRRKLMNEHLAVLRSLMPESYVQRGDQASVIGGAIEFVKELEHLLQSLRPQNRPTFHLSGAGNDEDDDGFKLQCTSKRKASVADIDVTLIQTHANLRIISRRCNRQVYKLVNGFQALNLNILHLNLTTFDSSILYSINAKVEEGCSLKSADDIAAAVHEMLTLFEQEDASEIS